VDRYHWLLVFHVVGAFMVLGGAVMGGIFNVAALRRERPSEIAVLLGLTRLAVTSITAGMVVALVFGLWLVANLDFVGWGDAWVIIALILWFVASALGGIGGKRERRTRELAEQLAAQGDEPSADLRAMQRDPVTLALSWGSGVVVLVILILMIWKPGS
jgi:uncharacterized membrane protein